jgi:hypothetical protein
LELLALLPEADEINKTFYANVWQSQEIQHGLILDRLQQDLGRTAASPSWSCRSESRFWGRWLI